MRYQPGEANLPGFFDFEFQISNLPPTHPIPAGGHSSLPPAGSREDVWNARRLR